MAEMSGSGDPTPNIGDPTPAVDDIGDPTPAVDDITKEVRADILRSLRAPNMYHPFLNRRGTGQPHRLEAWRAAARPDKKRVWLLSGRGRKLSGVKHPGIFDMLPTDRRADTGLPATSQAKSGFAWGATRAFESADLKHLFCTKLVPVQVGEGGGIQVWRPSSDLWRVYREHRQQLKTRPVAVAPAAAAQG